ncbi:SAV_915 family protein [Parasphingorhabdus pacifica]
MAKLDLRAAFALGAGSQVTAQQVFTNRVSEIAAFDGSLQALAYTSEAALRLGCGPHQAAAPVPAGLLGDIRRQCGAHTICLDTPLPERLRHGGEE